MARETSDIQDGTVSVVLFYDIAVIKKPVQMANKIWVYEVIGFFKLPFQLNQSEFHIFHTGKPEMSFNLVCGDFGQRISYQIDMPVTIIESNKILAH